MMEFIDVILLHIDQCQIQTVVLDEITGTNGSVFFQHDRHIRVFLLKCSQKFRKEYRTEHGRNADSDRRFVAG